MTVRYTDLMRTEKSTTTFGTREELIAELERLREGWDHLGKPNLARECVDAAYDLKTGCSTTQVGITRYEVTDPHPGRSIPNTSRSTDRA